MAGSASAPGSCVAPTVSSPPCHIHPVYFCILAFRKLGPIHPLKRKGETENIGIGRTQSIQVPPIGHLCMLSGFAAMPVVLCHKLKILGISRLHHHPSRSKYNSRLTRMFRYQPSGILCTTYYPYSIYHAKETMVPDHPSAFLTNQPPAHLLPLPPVTHVS